MTPEQMAAALLPKLLPTPSTGRSEYADGYADGMEEGLRAQRQADARWVAETFGPLVAVLQRAHDRMDDYNAEHGLGGCVFCGAYGYTGDGLNHTPDCVLVMARAALARVRGAQGVQA